MRNLLALSGFMLVVAVACSSSSKKVIDNEPYTMEVVWNDGQRTAVSLYTLDTDPPMLKMVYGSESDTVRGDVLWEKPYAVKDAPVSDEPVPEELGQ